MQFVYYLDFITHISLWTQYRIAALKLDVPRLWIDGDDFNAPLPGAPIASGIRMMHFPRMIVPAAFALALAAGAAVAQEAAPAGALNIELNEVAPSQKGCKLTFVAGNAFVQNLSKVSFEFVIFDQKGLVERMAVLDFRDLPAGKTKVRQFDLPGTNCEAVKSLLINDAPACVGDGVEGDACMKGLKTGSKSPVELKG